MNEKEVGEIRRHLRRDRCNMPAIYCCYVNGQREIVTEYRRSTAMMSENEADRYYSMLKRCLSGTLGKNLVDISFATSQVAGSPEHKLLMDLRTSQLSDDTLRNQFYQKIIETVSFEEGFVILLGCDTYDVPFKSRDGEAQSDASDESYTYLLCAVCPVKLTKPSLRYVAEEREFHDGGVTNVIMAPALGFLFPAFDNRATNIYNALFYSHDTSCSHSEFIDSVFHVEPPKPAAEQKKSFEALLTASLDSECSMDVVQTVHEKISQAIELHKESKVAEPLKISRDEVGEALSACAVSEQSKAKFNIAFDEAFGTDAQLHPKNLIDNKKFEIKTPDISIRVDPSRSDLIETRVIGGVKYILICAEENVEVNGVSIHISDTREET